MIRSSLIAKSSAVSIAVALHAALGLTVFGSEDVQIEGGAGEAEAALGSSFANLAAGVMTAQMITSETPKVPVPAEMVPAVQTPVPTPQAAPVEVAKAMLSEVDPAEQATIAPSRTTHATLAPSAQTAEPISADNVALTPDAPLHPAEQESETIEATQNAALGRSLRPPTRPRHVEEKAKVDTKRVTQKPPAQTSRGNSNQTARAGTATGTEQAKAARQATAAGRSTESGNAAASNYPGLVMKKISRVPKPRVGSRGSAVIQFSISGSGGLSAASVAQSSGSSSLDQAALRVIKRAAPFPPPPAGARRSFSIRIKGAG